MIFYRRAHRAVVRVSPKVPLNELLPAICDKCEYDPETTLLFLNSQSEEPLDLTKSLSDYGIREVFAKDMKGMCLCLCTLNNTLRFCVCVFVCI